MKCGLVVVVLVLAAACGGGTGQGDQVLDSGIKGLTTSGPQCPVEVAGSPCPDKPVSALIVVKKRGTDTTVATVTSNSSGVFRVSLAPGDYTILPGSPTPVPGAPQDVIVRPHSFTKVTIRFDSGIR